jgi:hypothetical protein
MSKAKEVAAVLATAAVTMVVAVALLWPEGLSAADKPVLQVLQPKIAVGTCQFTMEAAPAAAEPGATPTVTLKVTNGGAEAASPTVWVVVTATSPAAQMSRVMVMPRVFWTHRCDVSVAAGATQTLTIPMDAALPEGESIMVSLTDRDPATLFRRQNVDG